LAAPLVPGLGLCKLKFTQHSLGAVVVIQSNQVLGFFEFQGERERGKFSVFRGLQKPSSAQIQEYLKMRRLPPAAYGTTPKKSNLRAATHRKTGNERRTASLVMKIIGVK
jgi:hypothetical protein